MRRWNAGVETFQVDAERGRRLSAECTLPHHPRAAQIARWPALASPWLPAAWRDASRLPALAQDCSDDGRDAADGLRIDGLEDGATLARPPGGAVGVRLSLRALGSEGRVQWLLDGRWIGETDGGRSLVHVFGTPGSHELTALADTGAWHALRFTVLAPAR